MSVTLGTLAIPFMLCGGCAIDYERGVWAQTALVSSLDTAALFAAQSTATDSATLTTQAKPFIAANYSDSGEAVVKNFKITPSTDGSSVTATATVTLTTWFMSIVGQNSLTINGSSTVIKSGINLEVALVLDNTASMSQNDATGNPAISSERGAAALFVNTVMPATQGTFTTKIAAIPYNNSVNLGTSALANAARGPLTSGTSTTYGYSTLKFNNMSGSTSNQNASTTCVTERTGSHRYDDASVTNFPVGIAYQPGTNGCSVQAVIPLQTTASPLTSMFPNMQAGNSTAGQVGIAWGWYALSPTFGLWTGNSVPAAYTTVPNSPTFDPSTPISKQTRKVMVLLTDGEYNSAMCKGVISGNNPNGYGLMSGSYSNLNDLTSCAPDNSDPYTQSTSLCTAIKAQGIDLFVVSFQMAQNAGETVAHWNMRKNFVSSCASPGKLIAGDGPGLAAAFASLANQIMAMRIAS